MAKATISFKTVIQPKSSSGHIANKMPQTNVDSPDEFWPQHSTKCWSKYTMVLYARCTRGGIPYTIRAPKSQNSLRPVLQFASKKQDVDQVQCAETVNG